jgi:SNF-related kinase
MSSNLKPSHHNQQHSNLNSNLDQIGQLYELQGTIGQGHFAVVKLGKHRLTGEAVAIKIIDKQKLDQVSRDHLYQEVKCMKLVNKHPNVVRLYQVIDTQTKLYLVQEYGDGGDMYDFIMKNYSATNGMPERKAKRFFRQIVRALKTCHDLNVVHRDLKPENLVFFEQIKQLKLTDFGFSNLFLNGKKLLTSCGSLAYSAPEILLGDAYDAQPVDIWSLGVILYMFVTARAPFQEASDSETLTMILDCKYYLPSYLSQECKDLIEKMLKREPEQRIKLDDILKHDWLLLKQEIIKNDDEKYLSNGTSSSSDESIFEFNTNRTTSTLAAELHNKNRTKHSNNSNLNGLHLINQIVKRENLSQNDNEEILNFMIEKNVATTKQEIVK